MTVTASQNSIASPPESSHPGAHSESDVAVGSADIDHDKWYSERFGVSEEVASQRRAAMDEAGSLAEKLSESHVDSFSGAWIEHQPQFLVVVAFAGPIPPEALEKIEDARNAVGSIKVELRPDTGRVLADLLVRSDAVHQSLRERGIAEIATAPDIRTGVVHVTVPSDDRSRVPLELARATDLSIRYSDSDVVGLDHTYGGGSTPQDGGALNTGCTTGFTGRRNGVDGFVTAGHCNNSRDYVEDSGNRYDAPYQSGSQHRGPWGDFQFHTTSHTEYDDYYFNWGSRTDVASVRSEGSQLPGNTVCRFGRSTGQKCDAIWTYNVSSTFGGFTHGRLVAMIGRNAAGGDSGGPWFNGSQAWGIHSGYATVDGFQRDTYSMAAFADEASGITIKT